MSRPASAIATARPMSRELWHLSLEDSRIGTRSEAYALRTPEGAVLIDPLPMALEAERQLRPLGPVVLTVASHQRAAWSLRRRLGVAVYAPRGSERLVEEPDVLYVAGEPLPGDLRSVPAPGPRPDHVALLWEREAGVLFTGDLILNLPGRGLELLPRAHAHDPAVLGRSAHELLTLPWELLCPGHGEPTRDRPRQRLLALLAGQVHQHRGQGRGHVPVPPG